MFFSFFVLNPFYILAQQRMMQRRKKQEIYLNQECVFVASCAMHCTAHGYGSRCYDLLFIKSAKSSSSFTFMCVPLHVQPQRLHQVILFVRIVQLHSMLGATNPNGVTHTNNHYFFCNHTHSSSMNELHSRKSKCWIIFSKRETELIGTKLRNECETGMCPQGVRPIKFGFRFNSIQNPV